MVTKALVKAVGGFDPRERGRRNEDAEFVMKCLMIAKVAAQPRPLVSIRRRGPERSCSSEVRPVCPARWEEVSNKLLQLAASGKVGTPEDFVR